MPFTPFHLGPGALFKGIGGDRFSFLIFGGSQVLMDIEPLVRILRHDTVLHGVTHTIAGAFGMGLIATALGRPLTILALRRADMADQSIRWSTAVISAFVGTFSHILLDGIMHADMRPLWPLAGGNPLLGLISVGSLHLCCITAGLIGAGLIAARGRWAG